MAKGIVLQGLGALQAWEAANLEMLGLPETQVRFMVSFLASVLISAFVRRIRTARGESVFLRRITLWEGEEGGSLCCWALRVPGWCGVPSRPALGFLPLRRGLSALPLRPGGRPLPAPASALHVLGYGVC